MAICSAVGQPHNVFQYASQKTARRNQVGHPLYDLHEHSRTLIIAPFSVALARPGRTWRATDKEIYRFLQLMQTHSQDVASSLSQVEVDDLHPHFLEMMRQSLFVRCLQVINIVHVRWTVHGLERVAAAIYATAWDTDAEASAELWELWEKAGKVWEWWARRHIILQSSSREGNKAIQQGH